MAEQQQWQWQEPGTAWKGICTYHITLTVPSREPLLDRLVIPENDPSQARVERTALGNAVIDELWDKNRSTANNGPSTADNSPSTANNRPRTANNSPRVCQGTGVTYPYCNLFPDSHNQLFFFKFVFGGGSCSALWNIRVSFLIFGLGNSLSIKCSSIHTILVLSKILKVILYIQVSK